MAIVAAVATVFGTAATIHGQYQAGKAADRQAGAEQDMARQEAAAIEAETAESVRRARDQAEKAEGTSRARAAGSGATLTGSLDISLESMSEEHTRQIDWMATAGASKARMAIMGGDMRSAASSAQASQFRAQMWGSAAKGVSSTYTSGTSAGWWGA